MKKPINKQKNIIIICILLFTIVLITVIAIDSVKKNEEKVIKYIEKEKKENEYYNKEVDYQVFTDYHVFGMDEIENKKYIYMWILVETYYVKDKELRMVEGSSMPYKFTIENDNVIKYENPKDGELYGSSIREMFPSNIAKKILSYKRDRSKLDEKVKNYYSYL